MRLLGYMMVASLLLFPVSDARAQKGHTIGTNEVVMEGRGHFDNWTSAATTIVVDDDGVRPRRLRRHSNAVLEIVEALRQRPPEHLRDKPKEEIELLDVVQGGSNREDVVNALDGDMSTFWEPAPPTSADNLVNEWWFTVDMGRVVFANRIVLRFVDSEQGDPFLLFDVLTSDGQKPISALGGNVIEFLPVMQTIEPNRSRRLFEIDLSSTHEEAREPLVRFVQVAVRGSNLDRGTEVSEEEYGLLDAGDQGIVEHTKRHSDGRESAVPEEVYWELEPERQGSIRHFRRERPRLAELEVWGDGDEILGGTLVRGGVIETSVESPVGNILDDNLVTSISLDTDDLVPGQDAVTVDLGSSYWVDSQRMAMNFRPSGHSGSFLTYQLDFSDGQRNADGSLVWTEVKRIDRGHQIGYYSCGIGCYVPSSSMLVDRHDFDLVKARFFRLLWDVVKLELNEIFVFVAEMQLFGSGYQPEVWLESDFIEMPSSQNLTEISWEADTPPGTQVVLQTKTGTTLISDTLYYKDDGELLGRGEAGSKKYYSRAYRKSQGEKILLFEEGPDWSPLSEHYKDSMGSTITSPAPRKMVKVRATLLSDDPDAAATLHSIRLSFSDPIARRLLGEVMPTRVAELGIERSFSLYVKLDTLEQPFDELLVRAPSGMVLGEGDDVEKQVHLFSGPAAADELQEAGDLQVLGSGDSLHVKFPLLESGAEVLRLDFPATLYSSGGRLEASLRNSKSEFWQQVDVGDATGEVASNTLLVIAQPESRELFRDLDISPRVASPNGDGINDEVVAEFTVVLLGVSEAVEMEVYDLGGRLVRRLMAQREESAGRYRIAWDGTDDSGQLAPPGVYAVRLFVEADTEGAGLDKEHVLESIALAY